MKVKQAPDDFQVEEVPTLDAGPEGPFAFYRLEKVGWATPDALAAIRRRWQIDLRRLSYGGLKDRHAHTVQYLTIHRGPRRNLTHQRITLTYLGQVATPYQSEHIRCNRFRIILRDLDLASQPAIERRLAALAGQGIPNYFDDQRFGSVSGPGDEFIARLLCRGQFEEALKLALAAPYEHDRAEQKREKATLHAHWGDWARCKDLLPRGHARSLVDYLRVHPADFKGAVARLRPDLRGLYLSAYQSHLWNRLLARWLERKLPAEQRYPVTLRLGPVPFPFAVDAASGAELSALTLPLPTSRWKPEPDDARLSLVEEVLAEDGLTLRDLQVRGVRELFFSRGERPALAPIDGLKHAFAADDLHAGRSKLTLEFALPRGSYATLIIKAATSGG
ncbi:MAG: tRNA pseudouridine(13) synthase TruD [Gemmataceae bacterium]